MDARGKFGTPEERLRAKSKPGGSPDRSDLLIVTWLQRELPPRDWLLEDMLCTTSRWLVIGSTGVGKTLVGLDFALALASGANFLNWKGCGQPHRVMYLDGELPAETLKERIQSAAALYGAPAVYAYNRDVLLADDMPPLNTEDGQKWLLAEIATVRPDVIIFDNIPCLIAGMLDEEHWKPVQAIVRKLTANRIAQIWLDQTGFNTGRGYGTKSKEWAMDTVALLSRPEGGEDDGPIRLEFTKARLRLPATAWLFKPVLISRDANGWTVDPLVVETRVKSGERKKRWFLDAYDFLVDGVATEPGYTKAPVRKVKIDAIRQEMVRRSWLSTEDGTIPAAERTAFRKAKQDLLAAKLMAAKDDLIWRIRPA